MLLNQVSIRHEQFIIERDGKKIALLKSLDAEEAGKRGLHEGKLDLRDIAGVGAQIWRGVDADTYVRRERETWS